MLAGEAAGDAVILIVNTVYLVAILFRDNLSPVAEGAVGERLMVRIAWRYLPVFADVAEGKLTVFL